MVKYSATPMYEAQKGLILITGLILSYADETSIYLNADSTLQL